MATPRTYPTRRRFWILAIANWMIAIALWGVSAYLGIARPASMFTYTILLVIAMVAYAVGFVAWVIAKFGRTAVDVARDASR